MDTLISHEATGRNRHLRTWQRTETQLFSSVSTTSYYLCFNFTYFTADEETVGFKTLNIDLLDILSCCKTFHFHIAKVPVVLHLSTHTSQDLLNIVFLKALL